MSSEQYLTATIVEDELIPFNIDQDQWAILDNNKKAWWIKINRLIKKVNPKI